MQRGRKTLRKLAPVIGLPHRELMRMAGRLSEEDMGSERRHPPELAALIADVEAGWYAADDERRRICAEVVRAIFNRPAT